MIELLFPIGKQSNGTDYHINLLGGSHVFISYSEGYQLNDFIKRLLQLRIESNKTIFQLFIATTKRRMQEIEVHDFSAFYFFRDEPLEGFVQSKAHFILHLNKEINKRQKLPEKNNLPPVIVIIDDVWDIIRSTRKSTGLNFLHLLLAGPSVGLFCIIASFLSYRNLFTQLLAIHPQILIDLKKQRLFSDELTSITALGTEIIFTPEDFVYLKKQNSMELEKLYKY